MQVRHSWLGHSDMYAKIHAWPSFTLKALLGFLSVWSSCFMPSPRYPGSWPGVSVLTVGFLSKWASKVVLWRFVVAVDSINTLLNRQWSWQWFEVSWCLCDVIVMHMMKKCTVLGSLHCCFANSMEIQRFIAFLFSDRYHPHHQCEMRQLCNDHFVRIDVKLQSNSICLWKYDLRMTNL